MSLPFWCLILLLAVLDLVVFCLACVSNQINNLEKRERKQLNVFQALKNTMQTFLSSEYSAESLLMLVLNAEYYDMV